MHVSQWSFNVRTHCQRGHALTAENIAVYKDGKRECRLCRKWRGRVVNQPFEPRTRCPHGHRYTKPNTYMGPDGKRRCRACRTIFWARSGCIANCTRKAVRGAVLCRTHLEACAALDEEYGAYWRGEGYY